MGVVIGPLKPVHQAQRRMQRLKLPVSIAPVPEAFAPVVLEFGASGLRWNGQAVVAAGN